MLKGDSNVAIGVDPCGSEFSRVCHDWHFYSRHGLRGSSGLSIMG